MLFGLNSSHFFFLSFFTFFSSYSSFFSFFLQDDLSGEQGDSSREPEDHWSSVVNVINSTVRVFKDLQVKKIRDRIWREYIWNDDPNFRYPQRFLGALVMLGFTGYDMAVFWGVQAFELSPMFACSLASANSEQDQFSEATSIWGTINRNFIGACFCTFLLCLLQVYLFLKSFKHNLNQIRRGGFLAPTC